MTAPVRLLLRADSGVGVGAGHVGRTLAIAEAWLRAGGDATLASVSLPMRWRERWEAAGCTVVTPESRLRLHGPQALVIDGYRLKPSELLAGWPDRPLLQVDDHGFSTEHELASIVVDQNIGAAPDAYSGASNSRLLLGPRYALLRAATATAAADRPTPRDDGDVVVFLGGSPPAALVRIVGEAVHSIRAAGHRVTYASGSLDVPSAFAHAKLAVITAGSTSWDLAALAVPMLVIPAADNQVPVASGLVAAHAAHSVDLDHGPAALVHVVHELLRNNDTRVRSAQRAQELVDGRGAQRVATALRACLVSVRPAELEDSHLLWSWANDRDTRASAFDQRHIPWDDHVEWMSERMRDVATCMLIGRDSDGPLGQVRIDVNRGVGEIDVAVAPERRGQGWAAPLLSASLVPAAKILGRVGIRRFEARVKQDNLRSARAFVAADFDEISTSEGRAGGWRTFHRNLEGG